MIANLGIDPLFLAVAVGLFSGPLPVFLPKTLGEGDKQALNALCVTILTLLAWGFTSYPWIWGLVFTMGAVAYGVNQAFGNMLKLVKGEENESLH